VFRIKICGITNADDARMVADCGADAIGLNFYPHSQRFVTVARAETIVAALPDTMVRVGLFVNATDDEICRLYDHLQLDLIQLHGDEPPEFLTALAGRPVMRAFRLGPGGAGPIVEYLEQCRDLHCEPECVLIDAHQPGQYGGTGTTADWDLLAEERNKFGATPLVLAGGRRPDNVAQAIEKVRPDAVDTASGVEKSAGKKDRELVRRFASAAIRALA
jgi:phosphoribosylanthranilate isomerase